MRLLSSSPFDITFSEPVEASGFVDDAISVVGAGGDGAFGTGTDIMVGFETSVVAAGRRLVVRTNGLEPTGRLRLVIDGQAVTDMRATRLMVTATGVLEAILS